MRKLSSVVVSGFRSDKFLSTKVSPRSQSLGQVSATEDEETDALQDSNQKTTNSPNQFTNSPKPIHVQDHLKPEAANRNPKTMIEKYSELYFKIFLLLVINYK
ncbi:UNVERIFIED_CONTAM: hypothetical protein PYX00_006798 [Menopon gallinae]|uniref:Uncharacterized protein n=1 Tax=Menopon gallinae TaxID=328185 RepID=A0AAW2HXN8_9NEOP